MKIILEKNIIFSKGSLTILETGKEIFVQSRQIFKILQATKLQKAGVLFAKLERTADGKVIENGFAVFYRGEMLTMGEAKKVREALKEVWGLKGAKLIAKLDELWENKSYQLIEILDKSGKPIGEFDHILHNKRLFIEDKSALGLLTNLNPQTGKPWQTFDNWALEQIYKKTVKRIEALGIADKTRPRLADGLCPEIETIRGIRNLEFQIVETDIRLQKAVAKQLERLKMEFPKWNFTTKFG